MKADKQTTKCQSELNPERTVTDGIYSNALPPSFVLCHKFHTLGSILVHSQSKDFKPNMRGHGLRSSLICSGH
jgi:hypothetical protein